MHAHHVLVLTSAVGATYTLVHYNCAHGQGQPAPPSPAFAYYFGLLRFFQLLYSRGSRVQQETQVYHRSTASHSNMRRAAKKATKKDLWP
jgi:hypothetical protein